jgi:SAM-dependent methyltransferase
MSARIAPIRHIANSLVFLGLIGTVIGFIIALSGVRPEVASDVSAIGPMVSTLISGMSVALHTTLVGSLLHLWLMVNVRLLEGEATKLPVGDASVDRAISVQVFEYLSDVDAALAELMRVVRPGGRVVIWDIDWSTLSWHSSDTERMRRIVGAWDRHLADPVLPRTLLASLRRAGFTDVRRDAHPFTAETMDPEAFGGYMPALIRQYLGGLDDIDQAEADAWLADLKALDAGGAYSFAVLQFCFTATRPAIP